MTHQSHIQSEKYRQWVKAGLGLGYLKEGLAPFCDDVSKQQHADILDNIKRVNKVPTVICGTCSLKTLQPDHVKLGNKQCPYGQAYCNCCYTSGKIACPNKVCGAIYDNIITYHSSTPPAPNWKNTQTQQWTADHWSITKCFINAPGYEQKTSAADTDCTGLLHVIINNKYFHKHVSCNMTGPNIFSKVRQYRNEIFHSSSMELDSLKTNSYIDDMIAVLQDGKELIHRQDAWEAVTKLQDLKIEDFVIATKDVEKVLGDIKEEMGLIKITLEATKEDCGDLKLKVATLESFISELKENKKNFDALKADLQEKLIEEYRQNLLQVSAMPCQPEHVCDFRDVYVTPWITLKSKYQDIETEVKTMSDIFVKDGKPLKSIYILGEAGSGKSSFCKSLVNCWCMAHSDTKDLDGKQVEQNTEVLVGVLEVMKKFNFLFFLLLRHCADKVSIRNMLEEYEHPVLKELLERESETCLIVLDGLDEWTQGALRPPKREKFSNYTIITTSRPWQIGFLEVNANEMQQCIYIKGFDKISKKTLITITVNILNKTFKKDKDPQDCERALANKSFISLTHTPMMLQQLICLWFDDRLHETSKCNLYTCMLDLFFVWYKKKCPDAPLFKDMMNKSHGLELPEYVNKTDECKSHSYIIQGMSRLAYETLIKNEKETSLTFDKSMFQQLGISDDIKDCCLKLGILSEEKGPSLYASKSQKSNISFSHKSIQEYLAALYIVLNITPGQKASLNTERANLSDYLSKLLNVKTAHEVLEQGNVLIMMCGLEPRLAKSISKLIYDIVAKDKRLVEYRTTIAKDKRIHSNFTNDILLIRHVRNLILSCINETKASDKYHQFSFDLVDLVIREDKDIFSLDAVIAEQNITLDRVISICTDPFTIKQNYDRRIFDCMATCKKLEAFHITSDSNEELNQRICDIINVNVSTLKCVSVDGIDISRSFRHNFNMTNLITLELMGFTVLHEDFTSICTFLSDTGHLQHISIDIDCECNQQHEVDLSKHKRLQYLQYNKSVVVTNVECTNLEVIKCPLLKRMYCIKVLDFHRKSIKLKEISLIYDPCLIIRNFTCKSYLSNFQASVTNRLIFFLPLLRNLRNLTLMNFKFTDNIITCPVEMKSIKRINLFNVTMSLTTWRKFVDSVASLPQPVYLTAQRLFITQDGEECNPYLYWGRGGGGEEETAAIQYVKEHEALFYVTVERENSTNKRSFRQKAFLFL